ncbi:MAG: hypothetical protein AAFY04_10245, partial [Pseudomonadota bacterium]
ALNVPVQYFYEDLRKPSGLNKSADEVAALLTTPDGMRLCRYFSAIKDLHVRRKLLDLVKSLAEEGDDPVESRAQPQNGNKKKRPLH